MKRRLRYLVPLMLCVGATNALSSSNRPRTPAKPTKIPIYTTEPLRPDVQTLDVFYGNSFIGPITYDLLKHYDKTGAKKRSPQIRSSFFGIRSERSLESGGYYFKGFMRQFLPAKNYVEGSYTNADIGLIRHTKITSQGYGIGVGWDFRSRRRFIRWLPSLGLVYEKNTVQITGLVLDEEAGIDDQINLKSSLNGLYAEVGFSYRLMMGAIEPDFFLVSVIPLQSLAHHDADNATENEITDRLYHGMRFAISVGLSVAFWLDW